MYEDIEPRHTRVEKVIIVAAGMAILEDYKRFPLNESNLYFVSDVGEPIWSAERPAPDAHYIRVKLNEDGQSLSAYTTGRHACEIDVRTGKILSQLAFK
jgi:hypothetical protein